MDKYEYNLKLEEIDKLVAQKNYEEAAKLADVIDWRRVRNTRTLCLISEIYEAAGRLEDSKKILLRAYKKSPVGRPVLCRLVEVTTALKQFDEALEYYSEYVQTVPHDTGRYILKYNIYKGRGSQTGELIAILEEYLGQEYTERWAYELAKLYQQDGQMQKCFATCDDLVLWFRSGKYVKKALELKMRYTTLTQKQQQIYEECLAEELEPEPEEELEGTVIQGVGSTDGEVIAETIMAETEKEIADQIIAHKAEMEQAAAAGEMQPAEEEAAKTRVMPARTELADAARKSAAEAELTVPEGKAPSGSEPAVPEGKAALGSEPAIPEGKAPLGSEPTDAKSKAASGSEPADMAGKADTGADALGTARKMAMETTAASISDVPEELDAVMQGMGPDPSEMADGGPEEQKDLQVELAKSMRKIISGVVKRQVEEEEDIPASMEPRFQTIQKLQMPEPPEQIAGRLSIDDILLSMSDQGRSVANAVLEEEKEERGKTEAAADRMQSEEMVVEEIAVPESVRTVTEAAAEQLTDIQREALRYTNHPEKLLKNKSSLPTYAEEEPKETEDLGRTRRIVNTKEELKEVARQEILAEKTIRIPVEEISNAAGREMQPSRAAGTAEADAAAKMPDQMPESARVQPEDAGPQQLQEPVMEAGQETDAQEILPETENAEEAYYEEEEYLMIPDHLRGMFSGFTEVDGLESQIANAIIQAEAKGSDRTSRNGNILIFGAHGSGKTTLAMNLAKAIAQDKGNQTMKLAKIYAADLNRKDIAATVAKIAGGTLIIEEAGDLEAGTVEQLTTAMEFRTDGLLVILEDEQQYIHDLLMQHPRFTMKFTAQIYIPSYTVDELIGFGQVYARAQDYVIGAEACEVLKQKITETAAAGTPVSVADVIDLVNRAIARSNKFFRKISMSRKRYDENDYVILFPKDIK